MATLFYPGCQIKKDYPEASKKLAEYIQSKRPVEVVGCCRVDHGKSTQADTALVVCNNCANIIAESGDPGSIAFVWEIIDNDPDFPFPDYHGEKMTIQDCWLAVEKRHVQDTIRSLMRKMNIQVVELPENHEKTTFCGMNLTAECNPSNAKLAPKRYVEEGGHMFHPMSPEERQAYFTDYCKQFTTEKVVCYCKSCRGALLAGGADARHILQLLFPEG